MKKIISAIAPIPIFSERLLFLTSMLFAFVVLLNSDAMAQEPNSKDEAEHKINNKTIEEEKKQKTLEGQSALEQVILFELQDEKGNAKEFVTTDERKMIEKKVKEYENKKNVTDRTGKVYVINNEFEVVSVKKLIKP